MRTKANLQTGTLDGQKSLLFSSSGVQVYDATMCAGRSIVFTANRVAQPDIVRIWSVGLDGNNPRELTPGRLHHEQRQKILSSLP